MSLLSLIGVGVLGQVSDVLLRQGRNIAGVIPQVIIEEEHTDESMITQHPVERSANISDHVVKQPARLMMRCGWSVSAGGLLPSLFGGAGLQTPRDIYNMLLDLQNSKQLMSVTTGKRSYQNMLIARLSTTTDSETENSLIIDVDMQEVILVSVSETDVGSLQNASDPAQNGGVVNVGPQQAQPVTDQDLINAGVANATIEMIP